MRGSGLVALALSVSAVVGVALVAPTTLPPARLAAQDSTPVVVIPTAAPTTVTTAASPVPAAPAPTAAPAEPAAPVATDVVTLVAWYANGPDNAYLDILSLQTDPAFVAGPVAGAGSIGRADFPDPAEGLPTLTINDSTFNAYLRFEGDVAERWTWFDDSDGARPATLVLQVEGVAGPYQSYFGTATFVSRDDGAGGVLALALRPPGTGPAAAAPAEGDAATDTPVEGDAAAEGAAVEEAPAEGVVDEGTVETIAPDVPIEEPTELGGDEGEQPAT